MNQIEIFYEDIPPLKPQSQPVQKYLNELVINELKELGEVSIILSSDKYLLEINKEYLNHNYFTDIITFNYVEGNTVSGDLFISVDRIKENAAEYNTTFAKELYRVIFHGVLHLIGYNDKTAKEKQLMREKEDFYLDKVDFSKIEI